MEINDCCWHCNHRNCSVIYDQCASVIVPYCRLFIGCYVKNYRVKILLLNYNINDRHINVIYFEEYLFKLIHFIISIFSMFCGMRTRLTTELKPIILNKKKILSFCHINKITYLESHTNTHGRMRITVLC